MLAPRSTSVSYKEDDGHGRPPPGASFKYAKLATGWEKKIKTALHLNCCQAPAQTVIGEIDCLALPRQNRPVPTSPCSTGKVCQVFRA